MDQSEFLRQCKDLVEYARAKDSKLSKTEVRDYFSEMNLKEEQLDSVYSYLAEHNVEIRGVSSVKEQTLTETDSLYLKLYKKELRNLPTRTKEEIEAFYRALGDGDECMIHKVIECHLKRVITLAEKYKNRGVLLEDLIQEGNLELISCANHLLGKKNISSYQKEIDRAVKARLISLVDEAMEGMGVENTILAKTNLLHEATKVLAEENGTVADIHELAQYTKMSEEEIKNIIELSLDEIKLGECKHDHEEDLV